MNFKLLEEEKHGSGRGAKSAGYLGSLASSLLRDAEYSVHGSRLLANACHRLYRYDFLILQTQT